MVINNVYELLRQGKDKFEWYKEAANIVRRFQADTIMSIQMDIYENQCKIKKKL